MPEAFPCGVPDHEGVEGSRRILIFGNPGHEFLIHQEAFAIVLSGELLHILRVSFWIKKVKNPGFLS